MKRWMVLVMGIGLVFTAGAVPSPPAGQDPPVSSFWALGSLVTGVDYGSLPWDVSADGSAVVGISGSLAFHWTESTGMVALPGHPSSPGNSGGDGVSGDGSMAAGSVYSESGQEACRWTRHVDAAGTVTWVPECLGDLAGGSYYSLAYGMSHDGNTVVGLASSTKGGEACRWTYDGQTWTLQGLGDLPGGDYASEAYGCSWDGSVVVGDSAIKGGWRAFRWNSVENKMVDLGVLPRKKWAAAYGCSGDGLVVVGESFGTHGRDEEAFRWTKEAGMVGLGTLVKGKLSEAEAANFDGSIIVGWASTAIGMEAFIWDAKNGMRRIVDVLAQKGVSIPAGWVLKSATSVASVGNVVTVVGKAQFMKDGYPYSEAWRAVIADYWPPY